MSDCDVAKMDEYMSHPWEPDHIHLRLKLECEAKDKRIAELEEHLMSFLVSPSAPDNEIEE